MADTPKRIAVISPDGQFGTIDEKHAASIVKAGGRVLSKQEVAEREVQARYDALPTAQKALGVANTVAGALTMNPLLVGTDPYAPPTAAAYGEGVKQGFSGGLYEGATRQLVDAVGGQAKGNQYAQQVEQQRTASPSAYAAGEVAGLVGGSALGEAGIARALPAAGIGAAGAAAGRGAAGAMSKLVGEGALGRAAVTAAEMGARGALEGGALAATNYAGEELLADRDMASDKLFAAIGTGALYGGGGGVLLGGAGSLAASGARAARGGLSRALARGEQTAIEASEQVAAGQTGTTARSIIGDLTTEGGTKGLAYDRAWSSLGAGFGLQSTSFAKRAQKYLPNKTRDVGEWMMRKGVLNPEAGMLDAARAGTPEKMIPKIEAAVQADGRRIGEITGASGGRIQAEGLMKAINDVAGEYEAAAATRPVGRAVRNLGNEILDSLGHANGAESFAVQDVLRERKALDSMLFDTTTINPKLTARVKEQLRGRMEGLVVDSLDEASGRLSGELAAEYKALKKDYLAGMIALEAAEDSAARAAKGGFVGLKDVMAGGGSLIKTFGAKVVREHGDAVVATMLYQAAERGTLTKWVRKMDDQIGRASKAMTHPPVKGLLKPADRMPATKLLAQTALKRVAEFQADPEAFVEKASRQAEGIGAHDPEIASAIVQRQVAALNFLSEKVPVTPDPDPMDPHPAPKMTANEQAELGRYAWYVEKPARFFSEVERGKVTYEGAEVAQRLMPRAFAELQERTMDAIAARMAKGDRLPYRQRLVIGTLLDMAATPSQRPDHGAFLQQNVSGVLPSDQPPAPPAKGRPVSIPTQRSALDRLEADGPGRR